jgi:hypothetical protein
MRRRATIDAFVAVVVVVVVADIQFRKERRNFISDCKECLQNPPSFRI